MCRILGCGVAPEVKYLRIVVTRFFEWSCLRISSAVLDQGGVLKSNCATLSLSCASDLTRSPLAKMSGLEHPGRFGNSFTKKFIIIIIIIIIIIALHHDGDRLQLAAAPVRRDHRSIQCVLQHQLTYGIHEKKARSPMGQEQAYTGCPFRAGPDHLSVAGRGSMPARRRVDTSDGHRFFGRNSIKCSWTLALTWIPWMRRHDEGET